jgi:endonuclease YncB( thermonuclease family)
MSELVFGRDVDLRPHAIDRYGRTVAQIGVDGKDAGLEMVRQGLAWVYEQYIPEASSEVQETYRKAQEEAKADRQGLWSDPNSIPPWIFRDLAKANQEHWKPGSIYYAKTKRGEYMTEKEAVNEGYRAANGSGE